MRTTATATPATAVPSAAGFPSSGTTTATLPAPTADPGTVGRKLAAHTGLIEPRVDADGIVYVRSDRPGFGSLWRFASLSAQALAVWVEVSADDGRADRAEAVPL